MKLYFSPKTRLDKWSLGLSIVFIIMITLKMLGFMPLPTFAIAILGVAGSVTSLVAIFINKDKSVLILLPVLIGLIILFWIIAEIVFPH
jgi:hypothetical protein